MSAPRNNLRRWLVLGAMLLGAALLLYLGWSRIKVDSNVVAALPHADPVVSDAGYVLQHYPALDRIALDVSMADGSAEADMLVSAAERLKAELVASGQFKSVGAAGMEGAYVELLTSVSNNLPALFSLDELERELPALLEPEVMRRRVGDIVIQLSGLAGIGQARLLTRDPLELRNLVLRRLADLMPSTNARFHRGHLLTNDRKHLLLMATPHAPGTDTGSALLIRDAIARAVGSLAQEENDAGRTFRVESVGSYRAALDNETTAKADTHRAILLATLGIALLLLLCFPRPLLGLLSLVPAIAGTVLALFAYSLLKPSISLPALGFGGAIVSISVDHGIAYLLFLDRRRETTGREASREVGSLALLAVLTSTGALLALTLSGFPILEQLGLFAALGVVFSFLFVHSVFPFFFRVLRPARRSGLVDVEKLTARLARAGGRAGAIVAVLLAVGMAFLASPEVEADLDSMNTVSSETLAAEELVKKTWGDVLNKTYVLVQGETPDELQEQADVLAAYLRQKRSTGEIESGVSPSMFFPGRTLAADNLRDWRTFWTDERVSMLKGTLKQASLESGLSAQAFQPFFDAVENPRAGRVAIPPVVYPLFGISQNRAATSLMALCAVTPGATYNGEQFYQGAQSAGQFKVLDVRLFSQRLSLMIADTFTLMLLICGIGVVVMLLLYFLELLLPLLVLAPVAFSLLCTLGTLRLLGRPLDIPGLLLAVVPIGMGIDYAILFVRSHQRYLDENHPSFGPIRSAVFLASMSTLIGFGALGLADHALLRSAGTTGFLAIGYSVLGTFVLLPPLLRVLFAERPHRTLRPRATPREHRRLALKRYRYLETYARMFARFKMLLDPMFPKLITYVRAADTVLDVGCGYGVPATWLTTALPDLKVFGVEPDPQRVRVARRALGERGVVVCGRAPDLPPEPAGVDVALMLDMAHYLSDAELAATINDLRQRLRKGGRLVMRVTVPTPKKFPWERTLERLRVKLLKLPASFRTAEQLTGMLAAAGLNVDLVEPTAPGREETWFIASAGAPDKPPAGGAG